MKVLRNEMGGIKKTLEELKRINRTRAREKGTNVRIGEGEDRDRWPTVGNRVKRVGRAGRTYVEIAATPGRGGRVENQPQSEYENRRKRQE